MSNDYLFVYGTLRAGYDLDLKRKIKQNLKYMGKGKIEARLFDLGEYPGAVKTKKGDEVIGDIFQINDPDKVLKILDRYEGFNKNKIENSEFVRSKNQVKINGKSIDAWVYWYNLQPDKKSRIKNKDYLNYLVKKKESIT